MDFARKQLEKYGWKDGKGLGRNESGMANALKPTLKLNKHGIGHKLSDELVNTWWQRLYDEAAMNIKTKQNGDTVLLESNDKSFEIGKKKSKKEDADYKGFVKTSELTKQGERKIGNQLDASSDEEDKADDEQESARKSRKIDMRSGILDLTEEELFKACGGRTAHKGARHGVKMSAKLARIQEQESFLCNTIVNVCDKKSNRSNSNNLNAGDDNSFIQEEEINTVPIKKKKKKSKKEKCLVYQNGCDEDTIDKQIIGAKKKKRSKVIFEEHIELCNMKNKNVDHFNDDIIPRKKRKSKVSDSSVFDTIDSETQSEKKKKKKKKMKNL